jgi:hypothetical protein
MVTMTRRRRARTELERRIDSLEAERARPVPRNAFGRTFCEYEPGCRLLVDVWAQDPEHDRWIPVCHRHKPYAIADGLALRDPF